MKSIVNLRYKILKHPLDKVFDDIPGGSAAPIPRNWGITKKKVFCEHTSFFLSLDPFCAVPLLP
jgi:hypothetical protein